MRYPHQTMNGNEICTVQTRKVNLCEEIKRDIENLQAGDMRGIIGYFSMKSDGREGNEGGDIFMNCVEEENSQSQLK